MKYLLSTLQILVIFACLADVQAQVKRSKILTGYVHNLGNQINWPGDIKEYNLVVLSSDPEIIREFQKMTQTEKLHGKKINLTVLSSPDPTQLIHSNLVFISEDQLKHYMTVYDIIEGYQILLISENFDNKGYVMLNLFDTNANKIRFEINRPNIINQRLSISDKVVLMGGNEIDAASIYLRAQHSLRQMELSEMALKQSLQNQLDDLEQMRQQVEEGNSNLEQQQATIVEQKSTIDAQKNELALLASTTASLQQSIENQKGLLKQEQAKLAPMRDSLALAQNELNQQLISLKEGEIRLKEQREQIDEMNTLIARKDTELGQSATTIERQQRVVLIFGGLILFIAVLLILVIIEFRKNRQKNRLLNAQKAELNNTIAELRTTQEKLVQSEKMASLGVLTAGIAHEINNPVNFVYTGTSNLKQEFDDLNIFLKEINDLNPHIENPKAWVEKIEKLKAKHQFSEIYGFLPQIIDDVIIGAERITEIVKGLRNFSRMDYDDYSDSDIHKIVEGSLILLKNELKDGIEVEENFDKNLPIIECNFGKISQVVLNILNNAVAEIKGNGKITISTWHDENMVHLSIKDNGKGMSKEVQEKIFDPFFTTKQVGEGTGLGLSISYGIVKDHGGNIKVISEENNGAEFIISLPINRPQ